LNYAVTPERVEKALAVKAIAKLDEDTQASIRAALESLDRTHVWTNRASFDKEVGPALGSAGVGLTTPQRKALLDALSEPDPKADTVLGRNGAPEPDPSLRDTENVPLDQDIDEYFQREVKPHVPHAWIERDRTKVGYEIPFTRHFYKYVPPRPLEEIDADVQRVISEIEALFAEVKA